MDVELAFGPMTAMRLILARSSGSKPSFFKQHDGFLGDFERQRLVFGRVVLVNADFGIRAILAGGSNKPSRKRVHNV